jgi:signal peptidase I
MNSDAEQPNDAPDEPKMHKATLSEPKAKPGAKPDKKAKKPKKERPEPETPMGKLWHNWVKPIGTVIVIVVVFRSMLLDWNDVPTGSMEPEIHVGDRIAVNRLAYGLQFPLTGPQIGIPFTPIQFDNPLDGIPQVEWGSGPARGDIVTFWNPVTDVRMVKRIVAVPGDIIELRNSEMIINGESAAYETLDAIDEGLALNTKYNDRNPRSGLIEPITKPLVYRRESLVDQVRITQHIEERWVSYAIIEAPDGTFQILEGRTVEITVDQPIEPGSSLTIPVKKRITVDEFLENNPGRKVVARIDRGKITIDGKDVSYNEFVAFYMQRYQSGPEADLLSKIGLAVDGQDLKVDDEPVFSEQFNFALTSRFEQLSEAEQNALRFSFAGDLSLIRSLLSTNFGPYTVPDEGYLMIGDNRNNSSDGRFFGPVQRSEITGKAFAVAFSFEDNKMFALPPDPAWSRFFKDLD